MKIYTFVVFLIYLSLTASLNSLDIDEEYVQNSWEKLDRQLKEIEEIRMVDNDLSEESLVKIFSHQLPKIQSINLTSSFEQNKRARILTRNIVKAIFKSTYFSRLKILQLSGTNLDDRSFAFLEEQNLTLNASLQSLYLGELFIGKKGFSYLSRINFQGQIRKLQVADSLLIEPESVDSLLKIICQFDQNQTCNSELQVLGLSKTEITRDGMIKILKTINTNNITHLYLDNLNLHKKEIVNDGFNYTAYEVLANTSFPTLQVLSFVECDITDEIATILSKWETPSLYAVTVAANPLSNQGIKSLFNKKRTPLLTNINIFGTDVTDEVMTYLKNEQFILKFFYFGNTKITDEGFKILTEMNLTELKSIQISDLYISEDVFLSVMNQIHIPKIEQMIIINMNNLRHLISELDWKNFRSLKKLIIQNTNILDGMVKFDVKNRLLPNLEELILEDVGLTIEIQQQLLNNIPKLFPSIKKIFIWNKIPSLINLLIKSNYKEGTKINLGFINMIWKNNKFIIKQLYYPVILVLGYINQIQTMDDFKIAATKIVQIIDLTQLQKLYFVENQQLEFMKIFLDAAGIKKMTKLSQTLFNFQTNSEDFFSFFDHQTIPNLRMMIIPLTIPGDTPESFVTQTLLPFFKSFPNLVYLSIRLTFLNEEEGHQQKKLFLDSLYYPFLQFFQAEDQQFQAGDIATFISKHSSTLRTIDLNSNFLQKGFFNLLSQNNVMLQQLLISSISFTEQQFTLFGKVSTQHLIKLTLDKNGLTNNHIISMLETKRNSSKLFFPKLQQLKLLQNDIRAQGFEALMKTQMMNLKQIDIGNNNNPQFINILLKYPNRIESISAEKVQIYSLDQNINPHSVHNVRTLILKTYSFTQEDYRVLSNLEFSNLQVSILLLKNIDSCQVLRSILKMNQYAHKIANIFSNDEVGLNSTCLTDVKNYTTTISLFQFIDEYSTTFLPEYIQLVTNTQQSIKILVLVDTRLSPSSLKKILSHNFNGITRLQLTHNYLDDKTFRAFLENDLSQLYYLDLGSNPITTKGISYLVTKKLPSLQYLDLSRTLIDDQAIRLIQNFAPQLKLLVLSGCGLTDTALTELLRIKFEELMVLYLDYNLFTEQQVFNFVANLERSKIPKLYQLQIQGVRISKQKYLSMTKILNGKNIKFKLDKSYNIEIPNAAKY